MTTFKAIAVGLAAFLRCRGGILVLAISVSVLAGSCGKKSRPLPQPPQTGSASTSAAESAIPVDPTAPQPELDILLEPMFVRSGESAMLTWEARHADRVVIDNDIGPVIVSGKIKLFPDRTTTYNLTAEGPGGSFTRSATVEVGNRDPSWNAEEVDTAPLEERFRTSVKPVFFDFDSAELTGEARIILDGNIRWLQRPDNRAVRFVIEGHCDERGTEEYNLALGDKRAQIVRSYLVSNGIGASRISTISLGEERPFATGGDEEDHALNRRAHFVIVSDKQISSND